MITIANIYAYHGTLDGKSLLETTGYNQGDAVSNDNLYRVIKRFSNTKVNDKPINVMILTKEKNNVRYRTVFLDTGDFKQK